MKDLRNAPFVVELGETTDNMYRLGWNERNGGNISILLRDEEVAPYLEGNDPVLRDLPLAVAFPEFAGRYFLVTGTGKYFKNVSKHPEVNLGLVRISEDGAVAHLLWGYSQGGGFTSEIIMHLGAHRARLAKDPAQRVVMHAHPANTVSMTHVHSWDEREFTRTIFGTCTECIVIFPDGIGLLLAARLIGKRLPEKATGIDTAEWLVSLAEERGLRLFLLGGEEGVAEDAARRLCNAHPKLCICGTHHGYFDKRSGSADTEALLSLLRGARAELLFVCFGAPRQERWIAENAARIPTLRLAMGLGGALDVWSGRVRRAPRCWQRAGLEWLWRTLREPTRIKRIAKLPAFLWTVYHQHEP